MNLKRNNIMPFFNRTVFMTALIAMLFQTIVHVWNFPWDASQETVSIELAEDVGEKELEEETETEKNEWQSEPHNVAQIALNKRANILNKLQIILAFSPETHSPPPEQL